MPRTVIKVCEGVWWLRPILVLNLSLDQAVQKKSEETLRTKKITYQCQNLKKFILRP